MHKWDCENYTDEENKRKQICFLGFLEGDNKKNGKMSRLFFYILYKLQKTPVSKKRWLWLVLANLDAGLKCLLKWWGYLKSTPPPPSYGQDTLSF